MISSVGNPSIRRVRRLRKRTWRERRSLVLVEGHRSVAAALDAGVAVEQVFYTARAARLRAPLLATAKAAGARINEVSPEVMVHLTSVTTQPDVLGVAPLRDARLEAVAGGSAVLLRRVRDPATAGAIMATAAAVGMDAAVLTAGSVDAFLPKTVRAAQGAHFRLRVVRDVDAETAFALLGGAGPRLVALAGEGKAPWEADLRGPAVVVIDGEDEPGEVPGAAVSLAVPARGQGPSLTARAAVVLYEWLRQQGT